jgi:hypothetical protein
LSKIELQTHRTFSALVLLGAGFRTFVTAAEVAVNVLGESFRVAFAVLVRLVRAVGVEDMHGVALAVGVNEHLGLFAAGAAVFGPLFATHVPSALGIHVVHRVTS